MAKKSSRQIRTSANYSSSGTAEKNSLPSETVQGQSEPLAALLGRVALQQDVPINAPSYEEVLGADIRAMDKVERKLFAKSIRGTIAAIQQNIQLTEDEKAESERLELESLREQMKAFKAEEERRNQQSAQVPKELK